MFEQAEQDGKTKQKRENDHTVFKQSELEGKKEEREQLKKKKSYRSVSFGFFPPHLLLILAASSFLVNFLSKKVTINKRKKRSLSWVHPKRLLFTPNHENLKQSRTEREEHQCIFTREDLPHKTAKKETRSFKTRSPLFFWLFFCVAKQNRS